MDCTFLVRERACGSKLESAFQRKRGKILDETEHTLTFLPEGKKKPTKWSKRDVAKSYSPSQKEEAMKPQRKRAKNGDVSNYSPPIYEFEEEEEKEGSENEMPTSSKRGKIESCSSSEITPISTNINSEEAVKRKGEEASQGSVATTSKETKSEKVATTKKMATLVKETKATKTPQNNINTQPRISRKRRATQRYGIDVIMAIKEENKE